MYCSFLDELEGLLGLGDLEQVYSTPLVGGEAACLWDYALHRLGVLGETPEAVM